MVGLRDFLGGLGASSASAGLLVFRCFDLFDLGPVLGREVLHLCNEGGVLQDGIDAGLLVPV